MKVLGLTGGVGMGKSASAELLRARHVPVVDTDDLARQVVEPGQPALTEVRAAFGPDVIGPDGQLRRDELARRVFADSAARKRLEEILHPRIRTLWRAQVEAWRAQGSRSPWWSFLSCSRPSAEAELDFTVCIACSAATQRQRLLARGWSSSEIEQRLRAQWPIDVKIARSDYVVWAEGGLDLHGAQLDRIFATVAGSGPAGVLPGSLPLAC